MSDSSQQLDYIINQFLHHKDPPFGLPAFSLEKHLRQSSATENLGDDMSTAGLLRHVIDNDIALCKADQLDQSYLEFMERCGPGTLARKWRIFAPLPAASASQASSWYHTHRLRQKFNSIDRKHIAHSFPIGEAIFVFGKHVEQDIWLAFRVDDAKYSTYVYAFHENLELSPPPMTISKHGFVGFLKRACRLKDLSNNGNQDEDADSDDDEEDGDFLADVLDRFKSPEDSEREEEQEDGSDDDEDLDDEEAQAILREFRRFADQQDQLGLISSSSLQDLSSS